MKQIAFPFINADSYNPNDFIKSKSNEEACYVIDNWPKYWGVQPYSRALILQGPKYCGKTFLAKRWKMNSNALFINSLHEINEEVLKQYEAFIVEDIDYGWQEEDLLHLFNVLSENKKYLLMTCCNLPKIQLPDLLSRLKSLNLIMVNQPDDEMMRLLIFKLFSNSAVIVNMEVINFLIKSLPREFPAIIESVKAINEFAMRNKRKITIPLIKTALYQD